MIPAPKLDDRTYADIVAEAMRLIPRYCPEWTNHNPSDPGITIVELTAWMTELNIPGQPPVNPCGVVQAVAWAKLDWVTICAFSSPTTSPFAS